MLYRKWNLYVNIWMLSRGIHYNVFWSKTNIMNACSCLTVLWTCYGGWSWQLLSDTEEEEICLDNRVCCSGAYPFYRALSQRGFISSWTQLSQHTTRVLDSIQMAVFTSAKSAQHVNILLLRHKQMSRITRGTDTCDFRIRHSICTPDWPISKYSSL